MSAAATIRWACWACVASVLACGAFGNDEPLAAPMDAGAPLAPLDDGAASATDAASGSLVEVVLAKIAAPHALFAVGGSLFFTNGTKDVSVCSAADCHPSALSNGTSVKSAVAATADAVLALDTVCGNAVRSDGVYLYARSGGGKVTLGDPCPTSVTAAGSFVFYVSAGLETQGTSWSINRCTATTCEAIAGDAAAASPFGTPKVVAATASDVFVGTANGKIQHFANQPSAGPGNQVMTSEFFTDLATDGVSLAWLDGTRVRSCTIADCAGTVHTVAMDSTARHLAMGTSGLYWTSAGSGGTDGKVLHVPPKGVVPAAIATGQSGPDAIALDAAFVYWTTAGCDGCGAGEGAIMRRTTP